MKPSNQAEVERRRTLSRVVDDYGPLGYWGRKEAKRKIWGKDRGDLAVEGEAPARRRRQKYARTVKYLLKNGETP